MYSVVSLSRFIVYLYIVPPREKNTHRKYSAKYLCMVQSQGVKRQITNVLLDPQYVHYDDV
jgi:hypothetical protein